MAGHAFPYQWLESELTNWTVWEDTQRQSNLYEEVLDDNYTQLYDCNWLSGRLSSRFGHLLLPRTLVLQLDGRR
jgi:hypothetical protein